MLGGRRAWYGDVSRTATQRRDGFFFGDRPPGRGARRVRLHSKAHTYGEKSRRQDRSALPAGKATPAPPVGPALGPYSLNIMDFCKQYNDRTQAQAGMIIPVEITVFEDRTFTFITKTPPASFLIKRALGLESGSKEPNRNKVGKLTQAQCERSPRPRCPTSTRTTSSMR